METKRTFSKERVITVATSSKLTLDQTLQITKDVLGHVGCPHCFSGFKFNFTDEGEMINARLNVDGQINVSSF